MQATRCLVDTNILVYAYDAGEPEKRARAQLLLRQLGLDATAALPAQVLAEFATVCLRKLQPPLSADRVYEEVERLEAAFPVLPLRAATVREAIRGVRDHGFAYSDAQIWAAARLAQAPYVLSEDFAVGSRIEGVTFLNPLVEDFAGEDL